MFKVEDRVKRQEAYIPYLDNYLALLASILSIEEDFTMQKFFDLYDKEESDKRKNEIKEIRKNGGKTELEIWYRNSINTDPYCRQGCNPNKKGRPKKEDIDEYIEDNSLYRWGEDMKVGKSKPCLLINHDTGKWLIYKNVKKACIDNQINYSDVKNSFYFGKSKQIEVEHYTLRKLI